MKSYKILSIILTLSLLCIFVISCGDDGSTSDNVNTADNEITTESEIETAKRNKVDLPNLTRQNIMFSPVENGKPDNGRHATLC